MIGWTTSGRLHQKSNAKKVIHPSIISTLGNLTLEFPRDPDFSLAFKPPRKIQHPWFLCRIDLCEYIYRTRIDCRMLTTVKCARDWQWLHLILQMTTTHNYFLAVDGDIPFLFRSFLKGVFWLGWVNEWMKWVGVWVQIKWEMGMPYHGCWVASNLTSKFLPQPHFNLSLGRHGNYRWRRGAIGKILD